MTGDDQRESGAEHEGDSSGDTYWERNSYSLLGMGALGILALGTVVYRLTEDWSWIESFYFSSVALTTVGFGDFAPTSDATRLFTVGYIFSGIAIISVFINERAKKRARRAEGERS